MGVGGSGSGVGVGGWQIYEGVNPTTHRQLTNQGYTWNPAAVPLKDSLPTDKKQFKWDKWNSCTKKLFPNLTVKHEDSSETATVSAVSSTNSDGKTIYFNAPEKSKVTGNFLVCALLDQRGGNDGSKENIYFKSEVAVRDETYGWVVWNGLSHSKDGSNKTHMEFKLLLLKKDNNTWTIDKGFGWSSPKTGSTNDSSYDQLHLVVPTDSWKTTSQEKGNYSSRRVWSGIAKVDSSLKPIEDSVNNVQIRHDLLSSIQMYMNKKDSSGKSAEFFGGGTFKGGNNYGYTSVNKYYDSSKGWKTIQTAIDLGDSLNKWYEPQMDKELRWMTCDDWSWGRRSYSETDSWDKTMKEMCYQQQK